MISTSEFYDLGENLEGFEMFDTTGDGNLDWNELDVMIKRVIDEYFDYECDWDNIETPHDVATASDSFLFEIFAAIFACIGVITSMLMLVK